MLEYYGISLNFWLRRKRHVRSTQRGGSQYTGLPPRDAGRRSQGSQSIVPFQFGRDHSQSGPSRFRQVGVLGGSEIEIPLLRGLWHNRPEVFSLQQEERGVTPSGPSAGDEEGLDTVARTAGRYSVIDAVDSVIVSLIVLLSHPKNPQKPDHGARPYNIINYSHGAQYSILRDESKPKYASRRYCII